MSSYFAHNVLKWIQVYMHTCQLYDRTSRLPLLHIHMAYIQFQMYH